MVWRKAWCVETVTIKVCQVDDASLLVPLVAGLAREEGTEPVESPILTAIVKRLIDTAASEFLLALFDGQPVGCLQIAWRLSTWHGAPYAYLEDVYVLPPLRGRGIGRRMLMEAVTRAAAYGADQIMLDVRTDNRAAQRLYEQLGFSDSGSILMKRAIAGQIIDEERRFSKDSKDRTV